MPSDANITDIPSVVADITDILSVVADICGIISFIVAIILWLQFDRIKQEVEKQRINYVKTQKNILNNLKALRVNILKDELLNQNTISKLREELFAMQIDFGRIFNKVDKEYINLTISMLDSDIGNIDIGCLLKNIDYLIARFRSREV